MVVVRRAVASCSFTRWAMALDGSELGRTGGTPRSWMIDRCVGRLGRGWVGDGRVLGCESTHYRDLGWRRPPRRGRPRSCCSVRFGSGSEHDSPLSQEIGANDRGDDRGQRILPRRRLPDPVDCDRLGCCRLTHATCAPGAPDAGATARSGPRATGGCTARLRHKPGALYRRHFYGDDAARSVSEQRGRPSTSRDCRSPTRGR